MIEEAVITGMPFLLGKCCPSNQVQRRVTGRKCAFLKIQGLQVSCHRREEMIHVVVGGLLHCSDTMILLLPSCMRGFTNSPLRYWTTASTKADPTPG